MAINFPNTPTAGDTITEAGVVYQYTGTVWKSITSTGLPSLPEYDIELYASAVTASTTDIAVDSNVGAVTFPLNVGVVGVDGDSRGASMGFAATAFTVGGYSINDGSYTITAWVYPGALNSAIANRFICGSQSTASVYWEMALAYNSVVDNTTAVVDQWYTLRMSHQGDATGVRGTTHMRPNTWYHIAISYNDNAGSGPGICYVNSVYQHSRIFPKADTRTIAVGALGVTLTMLGIVKSIRFYNQCLSPRQIQRDMLETLDPYTGWPAI